jgi:hypothetical protein
LDQRKREKLKRLQVFVVEKSFSFEGRGAAATALADGVSRQSELTLACCGGFQLEHIVLLLSLECC